MNREGAIAFCLESVLEFEGLDQEELSVYKAKLNGMSDEQLTEEFHWWDYLWDK